MPDSYEPREGRVTAIRAQARAADRVSVYIDDAFAFGMHRDLLLEFDLAKGKILSVAAQRGILTRDAVFKARAVAFRYLAYRDRTAGEIRRRLKRDDYSDEVIDDVVAKLEEAGLIDDYRFAVTYADGRFRSAGYGPLRVRSDLRKKGVRPGLVDAAIAEVFDTREEIVDRAGEMGRKRWEQLSREPDQRKRKKKVYDYLARRGFRFDVARCVVDGLESE